MRWLFLILFTAVSIAVVAYFNFLNINGVGGIKKPAGNPFLFNSVRTVPPVDLVKYTNGLIAYTLKHKLNSRYCFLIDMKVASGLKRFYIYDLQNDRVLQAGLVTHGSGNHFSDSILFSNIAGSNCTSLGKYKIGKSYYGKFGLAYKLNGLDKTNSNAYLRFIVLHAHSCVPENEIAPREICRSWGCPTVSPLFLIQLKTYIDKSPEPMLLWIFN
jgi:L,D-transpeptidase catalytic domain